MIDHAGDIDRQRVERVDPVPDIAVVQPQRALFLRGGRERGRLQGAAVVIAGGRLAVPRCARQQLR